MIRKIEIVIIVLLLIAVVTIAAVSLPHPAAKTYSNSTIASANASINASYAINLTGKQVITFPPANYYSISYNGTIANASYYPIFLFDYPMPVNVVNGSELVPAVSMNDELKWQLQSFGASFGDDYYVYRSPVIASNGPINDVVEAVYPPQDVNISVMVYEKLGNWTIYTNGNDFMVGNGSYEIYSFVSAPDYENATLYKIASVFAVPQSSPAFPSRFLPLLTNFTKNFGILSSNRTWWFYSTHYLVNFTPQPVPPSFSVWAPNTTNVTP